MKKLIVTACCLLTLAATTQAQWGNRNRNPNPPAYPNGGYQNPNNCPPNNSYGNRNGNYSRSRFDQIDGFQQELRRRIEWGINNGTLTRREAKQLIRQGDQIAQKENFFRADGFLHPRERDELLADMAYLNQQITREKWDNDTRGNRGRYDDYNRGGY